jgi:hypothetical protein
VIFLGGLVVASAMSRPLGAQGPVIDAGLSVVHFTADSTSVVGPAVRFLTSGVRGRLFGSVSGTGVVTFGAASGSATVVGGARTSIGGRWLGELSGELTSVAGSSANGAAGTALLTGRTFWAVPRGGVWLRSTGHASDRTHSVLNGVGVESGAWWSLPATQLSASLGQEWTTAELFTGRFREGYAGTAPVRYSELTMALHHEGDRATLDLAASGRRDPDADHLIEQSRSVTTALWLTDTFAFVLGAAHQLPDYVRGADGADAFNVGFRARQQRPSLERAQKAVILATVSTSGDGQVMRIRADGARTVEIMADFTDWSVRPLTRVGDHFECYVGVTTGSHHLLVRIDGAAWRPAANTPAVDDDLGGKAGLIVVP